MHPSVSVIVPTYNHRDFILRAVQSALDQTYAASEIIVINDGSPDDTSAILRPLVQAAKIRLIEQANSGQGAARNRGIREARGEYVALLDDDDLWPVQKLERQFNLLASHPETAMAYGPCQPFGQGADESPFPGPDAPRGWVREAFFRYNYIRSPGQTLIKTQTLRQVGGFDESIWGADDWDLYLRLSRVTPFAYDSRIALRYRLHANNASRDVARMYWNSMAVHRKHLGAWPKPGSMRLWFDSRRFVRNMAFREYANAAMECAREGNWSGARRNWWSAAAVNRLVFLHPRAVARALSATFRSLATTQSGGRR